MTMENQKTEDAAAVARVPPPAIGSVPKTLVSEETFRSPGSGVDKADDMVRVTIDMPRTVWWAWKRVMFPPNDKVRDESHE